MASSTPRETAGKQGLSIETTAIHMVEKHPQDPFASDGLTPLGEKHSGISRPSDVSTPTSSHNHANPFDTDIEAIITTSDHSTRKSAECTKGGSDCQVWPGQDHWRRKAKAAKMSRHNCNCLAHLSKRNRIMVKVLIGLLIVGIAVGVGFGVSKPLGAGIWRSDS